MAVKAKAEITISDIIDGKNGKGIKSTTITYQAGTSGTSAPTGTWGSTVPSVPQGQYLWSKTVITYTDNTTSTTYSVAYIPKNGATGGTGATGTGVASIVQQYYLSTSKTSQTGGSWVTSMPTWSSGKYLWTRYQINYKNPTSTAYTSPICDSSWEAVNEIQVGGRNLILNSDFTKGTGYWIAETGKLEIDTDNIYGKCLVINPNNGSRAYYNTKNVWKANQVYSYSFMAKASVAGVVLHPSRSTADKSTSRHTLTTDWKRYEGNINCTLTAEGGTLSMGVTHSETTAPKIHIAKIKLELGNKPTDWTPAPEDVQADIEKVRTEYKADLKIEQDRITSTVKKLETVEQTANSANTKVTGLTTRMTSAETKINQHAESITLNASKTEEVKTNLANNYYNKTQFDAKLKVESDRITANVTETTNLGKRVSTVEQTASGLSTKVQNAEGNISKLQQTANGLSTKVQNAEGNISSLQQTANGLSVKLENSITSQAAGVNLFYGSETFEYGYWAFDGSGTNMGSYARENNTIHVKTSNNNMRIFNDRMLLDPTKTYSVSIDYKLVSGSHPFQLQVTGSDSKDGAEVWGTSITNHDTIPLGNGWSRISWLIKGIPSNAKYIRFWFRTGEDFKQYTCEYYLRYPKLEVGSIATAWSPNPETTTSNFMSYDANGLQIGNKRNGNWSGYRTQIKSNAFNILDQNGNISASYGADSINLGASSDKTIIGLCGYKGSIWYDANGGFIELGSANVRVRGTSLSSLYSVNGANKSGYNAYTDHLEMYSYTNDTGSGITINSSNMQLTARGAVYISAPSGVAVNGIDITDSVCIASVCAWMDHSTNVVNFSKPASSFSHGIALMFSLNQSGTPQNWAYSTHFIPKRLLMDTGEKSYNFILAAENFNLIGHKFLYISNTRIVGHDSNRTISTNNGITFNNQRWALRGVYGV